MEVRATGSNNFARLSNDLIAYKASESDLEVNGSLTAQPRMHLSGYEGHNNTSRTSTMKYDQHYTSAGTGVGDPARLWPQQGYEARNAAASNSSASAYSATSRRGHNANQPPTTGEIVRTSYLFKSTSGFGFTMADAPTGHVVKQMAEPLGHGQLQPGDIIVMIDGIDVRRKSHGNTVTMLKSYLPGSTVVFSYVRPNVDRNPHRRPHSAIPRSSIGSPMNGGGGGGGGGGGDGMGHGVGANGERRNIDHRTINHRLLTTHPEVIPSGQNGTASSVTSFHHPRTVSFDNSTNAGDGAIKSGNMNGDETMGRLRESRRLKDILRRRPATQRRSAPVHETQRRQDWMSPTPSVSNLNFSGTPDFIPASRYRPTFSGSEGVELTEDQALQADAWAIVQSPGNAGNSTQRSSAETKHGLSTFGPSITSAKGQVGDVSSNVRRRSLASESNSHQIKTTKSFDNEDRLQQMSLADNHQQLPLYSSQSMRRSQRGRRDSSSIRKHNGDVSLKEGSSVIESVDPSLVFNADIHRGSRGFGFSIRGGKEFNGMPLLVLDIAEGGPAYMDGRMKNGDQILSINGFSTSDMTHERAIDLIQNACSPILLVMKRNSSSTAKQQSRPAKT